MQLKGKKVLVTGADGFIGSHLVEQLLEEGAHVRALTYYNSFNSWGWLETLAPPQLAEVEIFPGDVRDGACIQEAAQGCEVIFHLAALIAIPYSYQAPESYLDTNVKGTLNILQAARRHSVARVLITSTSEVYGTAQYIPIDEKHPRQGQSPYAASKIGADALAESFYRSFNVPVTIVRPFNTFGPRQSARAVIPTIITQLLQGKEEIKLGALTPTRDLLFVKDTVAGFTALACAEGALGKQLNLATQREVSIGELAQTLIDLINPQAFIQEDRSRLRPAASEVERLLGDATLTTQLTGWRPRHTLAEGLSKTIDWFREQHNLSRYKADIYNV
ncbi:NAD dependent epimerase/dehydratase, LLPSF_EDH_00030 family [Catalinimonas alkaloidigena]|uniref:NAD dependent epimerase/dehydratase, LLPSF_EDH_00030 family n=1 Tax=Catalinimonas alkaloidigena TaxID=1075417 RepID=A0A1G8ZKB8_9BACT|nr:NAD-dependent 4,6-dehydratase LegB [Catalinimonas alkaloidigena]SDK15526.1 NAD dependent epimerase/dehydratase, LLPSF_EDH_00030 family [Catalinimonas alkaloidigena]